MEFSILTPVYKAQDYLSESVESVLSQDFSDYELVLVEDGSPDQSGALCDSYAARFPERIRVLHCEHRGTIPTRREAIRAARGEFILWLDSDDLLEPGMLKKLHDLRLKENDPDIILFEFTAFYDDSRPDDRRPPLFADMTRFEDEASKRALYELYLKGNQLDALWAKAVRSELFQNDPTDYTPYMANPYGEDALHGLYPLTQAKRILYIDQPLYRYRIRRDSVMHEFDRSRLDQRYNTGKFAFFKPFMKQWGLWDKEHFQLLKASSYRGVLDGILYFMTEEGFDQKEIREYADGFVKAHPDLKNLSRLKTLSAKQRVIFALFSRGRFREILALLSVKNKASALLGRIVSRRPAGKEEG